MGTAHLTPSAVSLSDIHRLPTLLRFSVVGASPVAYRNPVTQRADLLKKVRLLLIRASMSSWVEGTCTLLSQTSGKRTDEAKGLAAVVARFTMRNNSFRAPRLSLASPSPSPCWRCWLFSVQGLASHRTQHRRRRAAPPLLAQRSRSPTTEPRTRAPDPGRRRSTCWWRAPIARSRQWTSTKAQ